MKPVHSLVFQIGAVLAMALSVATTAAHPSIPPDECSDDTVQSTTPSSYFEVVEGGSIVRHEPTGLEWQRCALGQSWTGDGCEGSVNSYTWLGALEVANEMDDWRLPNINELRSIVEECRTSPSINRQAFPNTPSSLFWSGSPYAGNSDRAWGVGFYSGSDGRGRKSGSARVRLVRTGQ